MPVGLQHTHFLFIVLFDFTLPHKTAPTAVSKPNTKASTKNKAQNAPVVPQVPIADPTVAHAGMAVTVVVTLHPDVKDPRPIGDTIRFHRDASVIRRENKAKGIQEAIPATRTAAPELKLTNAMLLGKVNPNVLIQKKLKDLPRETFELARDAAAYCMERNQLEMKLASHAVSPSDVMRFGLERLLSKFQKQKPGFRGERTLLMVSKRCFNCIFSMELRCQNL